MVEDFKYPEPDPNKKPAGQLWEERYNSVSDYLYGKEPIAFLKYYANVLKKGRTLDVAMGEGRNSVYLASQGFQVEGVDGSKTAIERARKLADEKKSAVEAKSQNLDFFLMPLMKYDTVLMTHYRPQPRFFSEIRRGLVAGGTFLLESYTVDQLKEKNKPSFLEFEDCYRPNEILNYLKDFHILLYREIPDEGSHLVQVIAKKPKN